MTAPGASTGGNLGACCSIELSVLAGSGNGTGEQPWHDLSSGAYRVARWTALMKAHPEAMEVDAEGIKADLEAARKLLKLVTNMKTKLTQISSTVSRAV